MLRKQLITLAAILGILGCGACFLPDLIDRTPPPPPPPLHIDLHGVRTIGVTVVNNSETRHLDAAEVAKTVVEYATFRSRDTRVKVRIHRGGEDEDAELTILILKESAVQIPQNSPGSLVRWVLRLKTTASLTARSGQVIWQEGDREQAAGRGIAAFDETEFWQSASHAWAWGSFSYGLVKRMFYGESQ